MNYLRKKFAALWKHSQCQGNMVKAFKEIELQYRKPKRYYHTLDGHISFCVCTFFAHAVDKVTNPDMVLWTLFLHDIVMGFDKNNNDELSARWAETFLFKNGASKQLAYDVGNAIKYHNHKNIPDSLDIKFGLDIDLFIFAQPRDVFDKYENNIKKEYAWVEESVFRKKRAEILSNFLNNQSGIFLTDYFKDRYERQARANLKRSVLRLGN